jgi:hypothetical protein
MAKTNYEKVKDTRRRKEAAGLREIREWVPDTEDAIRQIRELAAKLREAWTKRSI